jgi:hypothetical protein
MSVRSRESFFRRVPFQSTDAFEHVVDAQQGRADYHSENPRRLASTCFRTSNRLAATKSRALEAPAGESVLADSPYAALAGGSARTE